MNVSKIGVWGWDWLGVVRVRFHVTEDLYYTMWLLTITRKFAIGFHVGGSSRSSG